MSLRIRNVVYFFIAAAGAVFAENHTFTLSGRVTDPAGAAVPRAAVSLYSRDAAESFTATADSQGNYALTVPAGEYLLEAQAAGLSLAKSPRRLVLASPQTLELKLDVAPVVTTVSVTATGIPQSTDEIAKAVDVIDRGELDRRAIESTVDALRETPGLRISQRGGPGSFSTIQTRGLRTFDTAVLIDGMRFRDVGATQGDASSFITDLLLVNTSRIEVLRGAGSSLYGTNATGGVVNIVTDTGGGAFHGDVTADGGGLGGFRGLARFGGGAMENRLHYSAGAAHQNVTDGVGGNGRYRNTTGHGLVDYAFRPGLVLSGRVLATDVFGQLYDSPGAAPARTLPATGRIPAVALADSQVRLAEQKLPYALAGATFLPALGDPDYYRTARFLSALVALQHQVSAPLSYRISYQAMPSDRNVVNGPLGPGFQPDYRNSSQFNGRIDTLQGRVNLLAGAHQLLSAGYEFEREYFDTPSYDENPNPAKSIASRTQVSERSNSFDAQDQIRLFRDRLQISLSGRIQQFALSKPEFLGDFPVYAGAASLNSANAYTGDLSVAYFFKSSGTKIRSHGGNGYRKPSLYERFGTFFSGSSFTAYGDPRLRPERSVAIDGGIDQYFASDRLRFSGSYFYTRLQQVIAFDFSGLIQPATDFFGRSQGYRNTGGGIARGVELSIEAKPTRSSQVRTSYTYTNARDKFAQFADGTLQTPRIFPHSFNLVATQQFGSHWDAGFDFWAASDYLYPLSRRAFVFPGPRQAGLSAGYSRSLTERSKLRFYTRVNNLGAQNYYEDGFRTPGRWAVAGVTVSF
ncbi:MAG: TonB-dependent receptor [Acidobacteriota bacterium]|nr:TonB-dependent receptor [Acidobacteriota bacterium]